MVTDDVPKCDTVLDGVDSVPDYYVDIVGYGWVTAVPDLQGQSSGVKGQCSCNSLPLALSIG